MRTHGNLCNYIAWATCAKTTSTTFYSVICYSLLLFKNYPCFNVTVSWTLKTQGFYSRKPATTVSIGKMINIRLSRGHVIFNPFTRFHSSCHHSFLSTSLCFLFIIRVPVSNCSCYAKVMNCSDICFLQLRL